MNVQEPEAGAVIVYIVAGEVRTNLRGVDVVHPPVIVSSTEAPKRPEVPTAVYIKLNVEPGVTEDGAVLVTVSVPVITAETRDRARKNVKVNKRYFDFIVLVPICQLQFLILFCPIYR